MAVDYQRLGELIDGYGGISADDLHALPDVRDTKDDEVALLRAENVLLRKALAEVELILSSLRGHIYYTGGDDGPIFEDAA